MIYCSICCYSSCGPMSTMLRGDSCVCERCNSCGTQLSPRFMIPHNFSHQGPTPTYVGVRTRAQKTEASCASCGAKAAQRISLRFGVGYCRCYSPDVIFYCRPNTAVVRQSRRLYTVKYLQSTQRTTSAARPICTHLLGIRSTGRYGNGRRRKIPSPHHVKRQQ